MELSDFIRTEIGRQLAIEILNNEKVSMRTLCDNTGLDSYQLKNNLAVFYKYKIIETVTEGAYITEEIRATSEGRKILDYIIFKRT